jgi:hypothetical protein
MLAPFLGGYFSGQSDFGDILCIFEENLADTPRGPACGAACENTTVSFFI